MAFRVQQIDHVELFVPDRYEAAKWYEQVLGLSVVPEFEPWATPGGPLMLSSDEGNTKLALFEGEPRGSRETAGHHRVAFRVNGAGFIEFLRGLEATALFNDKGERLTRRHVVDHDQAFSIYFCDPYGNRCEITSYDYATLSNYLFPQAG
jgi:catechol 2,3-dioxygenase-like lactoylglutathione lyase family enzyme